MPWLADVIEQLTVQVPDDALQTIIDDDTAGAELHAAAQREMDRRRADWTGESEQ